MLPGLAVSPNRSKTTVGGRQVVNSTVIKKKEKKANRVILQFCVSVRSIWWYGITCIVLNKYTGPVQNLVRIIINYLPLIF